MSEEEGEEEDGETSEQDDDEEGPGSPDAAYSPTRRAMDQDSGVGRAKKLKPMDEFLDLKPGEKGRLNEAIQNILDEVISPLLRKGTSVYLWLGNSGWIWGFKSGERACEDYIYCEKCGTYVDFWKYEHDERAAGHEDHAWRYATPRELKRLAKECQELGCFEEMG